jgi:hypothetical protein
MREPERPIQFGPNPDVTAEKKIGSNKKKNRSPPKN